MQGLSGCLVFIYLCYLHTSRYTYPILVLQMYQVRAPS